MSKKHKLLSVVRMALFSFFILSGLFMISTQDDEFEIVKNLELFTSIYNEINSGFVYELDPEDFMRKGLRGMLKYLDPYTVYIPKKEVQGFNAQIKGKYAGIGTRIFKHNGQFFIEEVYPASPASMSGLKAGDRLLKIDNRALSSFHSIKEMANWMRGLPGSTVSMEVQSHNDSNPHTVSIVRQTITIENTPFHTVNEGIIYIVLYNFSEKIADNVKLIIEQYQNSGQEFTGLILDLRFNPGGLLIEAVKLANLFLPSNMPIVAVKGRHKANYKTYKTTTDALLADLPITILINEKTASASEIVSGALQDYDRAVLIGQKSFGKGLVQNAINLKNGGKLKFTSARYYVPSGRCIQSTIYEKGRPTKIDSADYQLFKTTKGRPVMDGGGIHPDIEWNDHGFKTIQKTLRNDRFLFFYCLERSRFYKDRSYKDGLLNDEMSTFIEYCKSKKIQFEGEKLTVVRDLKKEAIKDGLDSLLIDQLDELERLNIRPIQEVIANYEEQFQFEILLTIHRIVGQQSGFYTARYYHDPQIVEAMSLLKDQDRYNTILQND